MKIKNNLALYKTCEATQSGKLKKDIIMAKKKVLVFPISIPAEYLKGERRNIQIEIIDDYLDIARVCLIEKLRELRKGKEL